MKTTLIPLLFLSIATQCLAQQSQLAEPTSRMWSPEELARRKAEQARLLEQKRIEASEAQTVTPSPSKLWTNEEFERRKKAQQEIIDAQMKADKENMDLLKVEALPGKLHHFPFVGHEFNKVLANFMIRHESEYEISAMTPITVMRNINIVDGKRDTTTISVDTIIGYTVALRLKSYPQPASTTTASK